MSVKASKKLTTKDQKPTNQTSDHALRDKLLDYVLFFFVCAFVGWIWEIILTFIQTGSIVNRGVLHGPWLPIYGFGGAGILILVQHFRKSPLLVFLISAIGCGIMEYFTGWYLETFKHLKWWDYSSLPLNLHGRVCLISVVGFGLCGLVIIYLIYPRLHDAFARLKFQPKAIICFALILLILSDCAYSNNVPNTGEGITSEISSSLIRK